MGVTTMSAFELRIVFVVSLLALGAVALLAGAVLSRLPELVPPRTAFRRPGLVPAMQTSPVRHRPVTRRGYADRRSR
jgi:hypothetical protein